MGRIVGVTVDFVGSVNVGAPELVVLVGLGLGLVLGLGLGLGLGLDWTNAVGGIIDHWSLSKSNK